MSTGAAPPGELLARMARTLGGVFTLPLTAASWFAGTVSSVLDGMRRTAGRGIDAAVGTPVSRPTEFQTDNPAAPPGSPDKEDTAMSDQWSNDDKIQLFQYTLVTVERDCERILEYSQRLVRDPLTEEEFKSQVIADYVSEHKIPPGAANNLRVAVEHLATWNKRPLHFEERQLLVLQNIAHSLGGDSHYDPCEPHELQRPHNKHRHGQED